MTVAQAGQYNYPRCIRRREYVAAQWQETKFVSDLISLAFLLNRRYRPFPKWMHRALADLPRLGKTLYELIQRLVTLHERSTGEALYEGKQQLMEEMCQLVIGELQQQGLSDAVSDFLLDHGLIVQKHIQDPQIRASDVWAE